MANEEGYEPIDFVNEQASLLSSVKKAIINFKKDPSARKTESYYQARLDSLNALRIEFRTNHRMLMRLSADKEVNEKYFDADMCSEFEEIYIQAVACIREGHVVSFPPALPSSLPPSSTPSIDRSASATNSEVPLPEVKLPTFNGNYVEWPTFKEVFLARVHNSARLTDFQRFHYLKGALSDEAALDIQHLSFTGENYKNAWKMLINLYDNKRILFVHYMDMFEQQPLVARDDPASLKRFSQTCRSCVNSIQKLGVNIDEQNQILVYYMLKKLPIIIRNEWDRLLRAQKNIPVFNDLCKFLDEHYQMMITSSNTCVSSKSSSSSQDARRKAEQFKPTNKKEIRLCNTTKKATICPVCTKSDHPVRECPIFFNMDLAEKRATTEKYKLCFNCLGYNHRTSTCSSRRNCSICGGRHHTLIHTDSNARPSTSASSSATSETQGTSKVSLHLCNGMPQLEHASTPSNYDVLLPTAVVTVDTFDGQSVHFRAFLDQGSQVSFVTERAAQLLSLPRQRVAISITGLAKTKVAECRSYVSLMVGSRYDANVRYNVLAYVLPKLSHKMPGNRILLKPWAHLNALELADPKYFEPHSIDLLFGSDIYDDIILNDTRRAKSGEPIAQKTSFGYIVSGKVCNQSTQNITVSSLHSTTEIESLLRKFWEIEEFENEHIPTNDDQWCENFYQQTHRRLASGKYIVRLPLLSEFEPSSVIGMSRQMALKRFLILEQRLNQDPSLKKTYQEIIEEYLQLGQMQVVTTPEKYHQVSTGNLTYSTCCYLPHHPVIKETSSTTKVRVVFDASAKTRNGKSLNDILATGPTLQNDLAAVLTNWRFFEYAFMADVEKMYRCIDVTEEDAQYQRILWRNEPTDEIKEYFCSTVMFGTCSAPFTAIRTIHQLADDEAANYPQAVNIVKHEMYVDDVLSGGHSIEEAIERQEQVIAMLERGTFILRKWSSNRVEILRKIPEEYREANSSLQLNPNENLRALGIFWNPATDEFSFSLNIKLPSSEPTKRTILSTIARLFDPLGWLNPIIVRAKLIMQQLWCLSLDWDECVPMTVQSLWNQFINDLPAISKIRIPRWLKTCDESSTKSLHVFCDASMHAYSAVAYLRVKDPHGFYQISLLMAKCKVSPIKAKLTIPRGELCAAVLAIKLFKFLKQQLSFDVHQSNTYFWSDSMVVLGWIRGGTDRWKIFVANRISKILDASEAHQWRHVISEDNPADCSSRGLSAEKLIQKNLWWNGPKWLQENDKDWPQIPVKTGIVLPIIETEVKTVKTCLVNVDRQYLITIINKFSSYSRLIRVTAYCHRFAFNCRHPRVQRRCNTLFVHELNISLQSLVYVVQRDAFPSDYEALSSNRNLPEKSPLMSLSPFLDKSNQLLRLGGRLRDALLPTDEKYPYILPMKHSFTALLINYSHLTTLHGGTAITLNHIRKRFWIINGRNAVRLAIHRCITCYKMKPKLHEPVMDNLPAARVRPARVFSTVGVDYAGPISFLPSKGRGRTSVKGYIALFICLVSKAVHLEPVGDLSSNAFIGALKRFIGRRGLCRDIFSDCGTNFVGANSKLRENQTSYKTYIESNIIPFLSEHQIQWHFIPPSAPHFGGLWEAGVKSMKYHLKRTVGEKMLTFEELATTLAQIESCLNSRPLCPLSNDTGDLMVLTPGHFLIGDSLLAPPEAEIEKLSVIDRWKNCQFLVQQFWRRWSTEYLSRLQRRPKWLQSRANLQINDIVLIKDERIPCNRWALGRIVETHAGSDNIVRVVTLKTQSGLIKRPVAKLCPLPIPDNWHDENNQSL